MRWSSQEVFVADASGAVDPATAAPRSGNYEGIDAMGPIEFMTRSGTGGGLPYFWGKAPRDFTVTVTAGSTTVASTTVTRQGVDPAVSVLDEPLSAHGFVGQYWTAAGGGHTHPAVMEFGGSNGGLDGQVTAGLLASHGFATLDVAYFGEPGLPSSLSAIPLEYFATALRWLAAQPGVDANHIYVLSASRGSEAALLLGAYYPAIVHGVVASVPSNVALCSYPGCGGPAWTLGGRALPYTRQFNNEHPTDAPEAVIPVERIRGPVLVTCGGGDRVWMSCPFASAIVDRLTAHGDTHTHQLFSYPDAGHGIGALAPYEPGLSTAGRLAGTRPSANALAVAQLWPQILNFLGHAS